MEVRTELALSEILRRIDAGRPADRARIARRLPDGGRRVLAALRLADRLEAAEHPAPPARVGSYRILRRLGAGGMGEVYLARSARFGRVAIKLVRPRLLAEPSALARFLREAEIGRRVRHPNVVRTLGAGAAGWPYLVMEFVEGQTLQTLRETLGTVPDALCRHIALSLARALRAIHAAGIVHRDVKPSNVMITRDHVVKLMDLGVACAAEEAHRRVREAGFAGSLLYAAPEQRRGAGGVDPRADLYALGVSLAELLTGELPVAGRPPDWRRATGVSAFLEAVVESLVAPDRAERFFSADELARVLERGESAAWWRRRPRGAEPWRRARRETTLRGRGEEMRLLRRALAETRGGAGRAVLVAGEAGIGKTRLVEEFRDVAERGGADVLWLDARPEPGATTARAILGALWDQFGGRSSRARRRSPARSGLRISHRGERARAADALGLRSAAADRTTLLESIRAAAKEVPVVVAVEDLHAASEDGRAFLLELARALRGERVLLLATARPALPDAWREAFRRTPGTRVLELRRWTETEVGETAADLLRPEVPAPSLVRWLARKSSGIPFLLFSLVDGLRAAGRLRRRGDGSWCVADAPDAPPPSARDAVAERVAALEPSDRTILDVAACCGARFDADLVARALERPLADVLRRLAVLERTHRLVRSEGAAFAFDHEILRDVVYDAIRPPRRRRIHAALARFLAAREDDAAAVVAHALEGRRFALVRRHAGTALAELARACRHEEAVALAERALRLARPSPGERLRVLLAMAACLSFLSRRNECLRVLPATVALADRVGDPVARVAARRQLGISLDGAARADDAERVLREGLAIAVATGTRAEECRTLAVLGTVLGIRGELQEAEALFGRALEQAGRLGLRAERANAAVNLATILLRRGEIERAREHYREARAFARRAGIPDLVVAAEGHLGVIAGTLGQFARARRHFEAARETSRRIGYGRGEIYATAQLANALADLGRLGEAVASYEAQIALAGETGEVRARTVGISALAATLARFGATSAAESVLDRHLPRPPAEDAQVAGEVHYVRGLVALARKDHERAAALLARAVEVYRGGNASDTPKALFALGRVRLVQGEREAARRLFGEAAADPGGAGTLGLCGLAAIDPTAAPQARARFRAAARRLAPPARLLGHRLLFAATGDVRHARASSRLARELRRAVRGVSPAPAR